MVEFVGFIILGIIYLVTIVLPALIGIALIAGLIYVVVFGMLVTAKNP